MASLVVVPGFCLYLLFLRTEPDRVAKQRQYINRLRLLLETKLGLVNLLRKSNGWDNKSGIKLMAWITAVCQCFIGGVFLYEGLPQVAINLFGFALMFTLCIVTNQSKFAIQFVYRLSVFHQAVSMWYFQVHISPTALRRTSAIRMMLLLLGFESIEESFWHALFLSIMVELRRRESDVGAEEAFVLLPIKMFLCATLPLHVLGIPESISALANEENFSMTSALRFVNGLRLFSCMIPLQLMATTFMGQVAYRSPLVFGAIQLLVGLALRLPMVSSKVDGWISPNTLAFYKPQASPVALRIGLVVCMVGMVAFLHSPVEHLLFVSIAIVLVLNRSAVHSRTQSNLSMLLGSAILINWEDKWLSSMLTFLCLASSFFSLVFACNKELVYANFAQENAAENFLSHAIKQKFASVGTAVEHILMHHSKFTTLLIAVLKECRMGHARCHSSTLCRNLEQGMRRGEAKTYKANLAEELQKTVMFNELFVPTTKYANTNIGLEMDWEIFHLVLTDLARRGLTVLAIQFDNNNMLIIKLNRKAAAHNNRVLEVFVTHLNGTLNEECIEIAFQSSHPLLASSPVVVGGNTPRTVLAKLKFALVDDNLLIRKNFERLMQSQLGIPADRILTMGETEEDCTKFLKRISQEQFDVAIFDQNLDYDNDIKGNELAKQAREMGFKGCLILHSSDAQLAKLLESGVFHGAVEKSAKASTFIDGIATAWQSYKVVC
ncbi:hypothetical protein BASA81_005413 [Batrachochytrium salamandrivorans]|nr:hypothetical protein BASA81_005413 [Batrachochytrium salamandrivorans]